MNSVEIEQLKNYLETKVGILEIKINNGEISDQSSLELVKLFNEYKEKGTTIEEFKLLIDDVELALS